MKILLGVCGIGLGHSTRQNELVRELISRNHQVRVFTFGRGIDFFSSVGFGVYDVWVPFVKFKGERVDVPSLFSVNYREFIPGMIKNGKIVSKLLREFVPDVCITDYEPVTARVAYKLNKPLVIVDQQSKFEMYDFHPIDGYSPIEERKRLNIFFPRYERRFITSFYQLPPSKDESTEIIPPILRSDIKSGIRGKEPLSELNIVVYLSDYLGNGIDQSIESVISIFSQFKKIKFHVFSGSILTSSPPNVFFYSFGRESFVQRLLKADGVITTGGHTLLSECMFLGIPTYVIPLGTFDQHFCAKFISENQLGITASKITAEQFNKFLDRITEFSSNISYCSKLTLFPDPLTRIVDYVEDIGI